MSETKRPREFPRVQKICFTVVKRYDENGELEEGYTGSTINLSEGGMLVETENPLPFLARLDLVLALEEEMVKLKGEVAHLRKIDDEKVEMGIKFLDISSGARDLIKRSLDARR